MDGRLVDPESAGAATPGRPGRPPPRRQQVLAMEKESVDQVATVEELFDLAAQLHLDP